MSDSQRVAVTGVVGASASNVFRLVTDPQLHVQIDGSGMLQAAPDARGIESVGDTFEMDMDREPLGDLPLGEYKVRNTVTQLVPDSLVEWAPGAPEDTPLGHVYGWEILELDADTSQVTNYCDWSGFDWSRLPEAVRARISFPVVPRSMLERSVENLTRLAAEATTPAG